MEPINLKFKCCPICGCTERFLETLANELKEKGLAGKEFNFCYDVRSGPVIDKAKEASIPIGSEVPAYQIKTDICLSCGCLYAIELQSSMVKKSIAPPQLIRPDQQFGRNNPLTS